MQKCNLGLSLIILFMSYLEKNLLFHQAYM